MLLLYSTALLFLFIFLSNFLKNYLQKLKIENDNHDPDSFWKFTYDHYDKNEFNPSIPKIRDSDSVKSQKTFKDRLIILYWLLLILIFITIIYISALILRMLF